MSAHYGAATKYAFVIKFSSFSVDTTAFLTTLQQFYSVHDAHGAHRTRSAKKTQRSYGAHSV